MIKFFNQRWDTVPLCVLDTETTGVVPGKDRVVQLGLARFESGSLVAKEAFLVNPGIPIPAEATAIHSIGDSNVVDAPPLADVMALPRVRELMAEAQFGAYNASFDAAMLLGHVDRDWPWVDSLVYVMAEDAYVKGKGRFKLANACERFHVALPKAHDAADDAVAAGALVYQLVGYGKLTELRTVTMGWVLKWTQQKRAAEWYRFMDWKSRLPPKEPEK